ncbi:MAG TPA: hypothetical protein VF174_13750, partial [Micromonosporaceae bacterium]
MRHLWSLLAGVVAAPLTWILIAAGQGGSRRTIESWTTTDSWNWANLIEPAVYLLVAGIVLGLLGTLRFSPAGPMIAGLLLMIPYALLFVDPFAVRDAVPGSWRIADDELSLHLPLDNGTLALIGLLLFTATFSVQRWRSWPVPATTEPQAAEPQAEADAGSPPSDSGSDSAFDDWPPKDPGKTPAQQPAKDETSTPAYAGHGSTSQRPGRGTGSPWSSPPRPA